MMKLIGFLKKIASLLSNGFKAIKSLITQIHEKGLLAILRELKDGIKKILIGSANTTAWVVLFFELIQKLLGVIGVATAVGSGAVGAKQIFDFGKAIVDPQNQMLDWLSEAFARLPSLQGLIDSVDAAVLSVTTGYFDPPVTFTYLLQVTAVGACFNQYLQALISTLIFVFSVFLVKWAFSTNFTFTKNVPGGNP